MWRHALPSYDGSSTGWRAPYVRVYVHLKASAELSAVSIAIRLQLQKGDIAQTENV